MFDQTRPGAHLADEAGARSPSSGDRHQLLAVGARRRPRSRCRLRGTRRRSDPRDRVRRFTDEAYAILSLRMREGTEATRCRDAPRTAVRSSCTSLTSSAQRRSAASRCGRRPRHGRHPRAGRRPQSRQSSARSARTSIPSGAARRWPPAAARHFHGRRPGRDAPQRPRPRVAELTDLDRDRRGRRRAR